MSQQLIYPGWNMDSAGSDFGEPYERLGRAFDRVSESAVKHARVGNETLGILKDAKGDSERAFVQSSDNFAKNAESMASRKERDRQQWAGIQMQQEQQKAMLPLMQDQMRVKIDEARQGIESSRTNSLAAQAGIAEAGSVNAILNMLASGNLTQDQRMEEYQGLYERLLPHAGVNSAIVKSVIGRLGGLIRQGDNHKMWQQKRKEAGLGGDETEALIGGGGELGAAGGETKFPPEAEGRRVMGPDGKTYIVRNGFAVPE